MMSSAAYLRLLSSYDPLARGLFDRSPEQGGPRRGLISRALKKKRAAGILSRVDCLWYMAGADSTIARQNWLSSSFTLTAVNSPTFTADRGYTGDAVSAYLNTGFTPSTAGGKYSQNDVSVGMYIRAPNTTGVWIGGQASIGGKWTLIQDFAADVGYRVNAGTAVTATGAKAAGLHSAQRTSSTAVAYYKDGASVSTGSVASDGVPDRPLFLLCRNAAFLPSPDPRNFSDAQMSMAFIGGSLTEAQQAALNDIVREYLTAVGAI